MSTKKRKNRHGPVKILRKVLKFWKKNGRLPRIFELTEELKCSRSLIYHYAKKGILIRIVPKNLLGTVRFSYVSPFFNSTSQIRVNEFGEMVCE